MATIIIAKNSSGTDQGIEDLGIVIANGGQMNLTDMFSVPEIASSSDLKTKVTNENLVINNGTEDLNAEDGIKHISLQTEYEDSFDEIFGGGGTPDPPDNPYDGEPWYYSGNPYYWDDVRQKWLTEARMTFVFNSDKAKGTYLKIGSVASSEVSYYMHRPATIVGVYTVSGDGDNTKAFELRDGAQGDASVFNFAYDNALEYANSSVNVDIDQAGKLKCWVSVTGDNVLDTVCQVEVAWRYVPS